MTIRSECNPHELYVFEHIPYDYVIGQPSKVLLVQVNNSKNVFSHSIDNYLIGIFLDIFWL